MLIKQENRALTDMKIAKMKMVVEESLVYDTSDYLAKTKLPQDEHSKFVRGLTEEFKNTISTMANAKLAKIGFNNDISIKRICHRNLSKIKAGLVGIVFEIVGFE